LPSPPSFATSQNRVAPLNIRLVYLSERDIDRDAQTLLVDSIKSKLDYQTAKISMQRIATSLGVIAFETEQSTLTPTAAKLLDRAAQFLQQHPNLKLEVVVNQEPNEPPEIIEARSQAITQYLKSKWPITSDQIALQIGVEPKPSAILQLTVESLRKPPSIIQPESF
ncbi:hypothetical protein I8751_17130, partial [Nostocaceae cyanobacterium CENA357]|nr:hypothetical protein [Atlanticothrix silvestris CENA357]